MTRFSSPTYNRAKDSASSGGYVTDLNPERSYDVDIRRLDEDEKNTANIADTRNQRKQNRVRSFLKAVKSANKYRQKQQIDEPLVDGSPARYDMGDRMGPAGGMKYAAKPQSFSGKSYDFY